METSLFCDSPPSQLSHCYSFSIRIGPLTLICFELSAFASKFKASYNCCKSVERKTLHAAPVDTFYRTLIIFFLTVLPLSLYANPVLALQYAPWHVAQLLGLSEIPLPLHPSEGVGWHHHSITPLQK